MPLFRALAKNMAASYFGETALRRISSPRTKLLAARCECLHLIKINCLALWLDESAHASLAASCEELRARTGNPPLRFCNGSYTSVCLYSVPQALLLFSVSTCSEFFQIWTLIYKLEFWRRFDTKIQLANTNYNVGNTNYNVGNTNYNVGNTNYNVANTNYNIGNTNYNVANTNYNVGNTNYNVGNTNYNVANTNYNVGNTNYNVANTNYSCEYKL